MIHIIFIILIGILLLFNLYLIEKTNAFVAERINIKNREKDEEKKLIENTSRYLEHEESSVRNLIKDLQNKENKLEERRFYTQKMIEAMYTVNNFLISLDEGSESIILPMEIEEKDAKEHVSKLKENHLDMNLYLSGYPYLSIIRYIYCLQIFHKMLEVKYIDGYIKQNKIDFTTFYIKQDKKYLLIKEREKIFENFIKMFTIVMEVGKEKIVLEENNDIKVRIMKTELRQIQLDADGNIIPIYKNVKIIEKKEKGSNVRFSYIPHPSLTEKMIEEVGFIRKKDYEEVLAVVEDTFSKLKNIGDMDCKDLQRKAKKINEEKEDKRSEYNKKNKDYIFPYDGLYTEIEKIRFPKITEDKEVYKIFLSILKLLEKCKIISPINKIEFFKKEGYNLLLIDSDKEKIMIYSLLHENGKEIKKTEYEIEKEIIQKFNDSTRNKIVFVIPLDNELVNMIWKVNDIVETESNKAEVENYRRLQISSENLKKEINYYEEYFKKVRNMGKDLFLKCDDIYILDYLIFQRLHEIEIISEKNGTFYRNDEYAFKMIQEYIENNRL